MFAAVLQGGSGAVRLAQPPATMEVLPQECQLAAARRRRTPICYNLSTSADFVTIAMQTRGLLVEHRPDWII